MSDKAERTAGEWYLEGPFPETPGVQYISAPSWSWLASVCVTIDGKMDDEGIANAAYIVLAANAFPDLVKALLRARARLLVLVTITASDESYDPLDLTQDADIRAIDAALLKARPLADTDGG